MHNSTAAPASGQASPLLTIKEVAARLGFTTRTLHRWMKAGTFIEPVRFGFSIRFHEEDVRKFERVGFRHEQPYCDFRREGGAE